MYRQIQDRQTEQRRSPLWWRMLSVVVIALVFGVLMRATLLLAAPAQQSTPDSGGDDDYIVKVGVIVARPVDTVGSWTISNTSATTYTATGETVVEGDLPIGACAEVKSSESEPTVALKIYAKEAEDCSDDNGGDDDGEDDGDDDHGDYLVRYGIVESRPEGKVGPWVIGGETYTATEQTELDFEHGALSVGTCAKVKVYESDPTLAKEIESEHAYKCGDGDGDDDDDDDDSAKGVVFGVIEELPADLHNGIWAIGGMQFVVSPTTQLVDKGGVFTEGVTVKVQFTSNLSDTLFARSIEIKFGPNNPCRQHNHDDNDLARSADDGGGDDDRGKEDRGEGNRHYGYCPGSEGKSLGIINSRPQGSLLGEWMIGGVPYMTNASTKFKSGDDFLAGERVKVEYVVISDTLRLATKIKEIGGIGGVNPNHSLIVGYVDAKPDAFVGSWTINGAPFEAISTTVFVERGSLFAVGSYVVVEYEIVNDQSVIVKILTYVPPGAGDDNKVGKLESTGGASVASVDAELQNAEVWTIAGVNYVVSEATQVVTSGDDVAVGATVLVNSYTDNGQHYATMIRAQEGRLFIPHAGK